MKNQQPSSEFYLPGLNLLRFIAASLVVISHIELYKPLAGLYLSNYTVSPWFWGLGASAVTLFFVISGFLITTLLIKEKSEFSNISIKRFYIRRIMRIWPLYFFTIFIAFTVLPQILTFEGYTQSLNDQYKPKLLWFLLIMPNIATLLYPLVFGAAHTWSIGVEEQFYLIWPILIKKLFGKLPILFFLLVIFRIFFFTTTQLLVFNNENINFLKILQIYLESFQLESFIAGAYWAHVFTTPNHPALKILQFPIIKVFFFIAAIISPIWRDSGLSPFIFIQASIFSIVVISTLQLTQQYTWLDAPVIRHLGKISYGIYMYSSLV